MAGERIRVAHLITTLDVGGAETTLARVVPRLDRDRFETLVVSMTAPGSVAGTLESAGIEVASLGMRRGRPSPRALAALVRLLRAHRPHVLQTWLYHADLLGAIAAPLARVPRLAWNLRASDMQWGHYSGLSAWTQRSCAALSRRPDVVVVNSQAGRRHHAAIGYRPRAWRVIPNGVDTSMFAPDPAARLDVRRELGLAPDVPLVGMVARLDPMKDHATFLAAAGRLAARRPDVRFVLVGRGLEPGCDVLRDAPRPVQQRLHALGAREDVPRLLAAFDVCALSSVSEGFPNVLIEAMSCGVACVSTDVGDARLIVDDWGGIVPPGQPADMALALERILGRTKEERAQLSRSAREHVLAHFSLDRCLAAYDALYRELACDRAPGFNCG